MSLQTRTGPHRTADPHRTRPGPHHYAGARILAQVLPARPLHHGAPRTVSRGEN